MWPFSRKNNKEQKLTTALYNAVVAQARQPVFYQDFGVKDNEDGRFDLLVLHLSLVLIALKEHQNAESAGLSRLLMESFIADMDASLREMGAGDLGVARRVKFMAGALNGRLAAYEAALARGDRSNLSQALVKNLYRGEDITPNGQLLDYIVETSQNLKQIQLEQWQRGVFTFPAIKIAK